MTELLPWGHINNRPVPPLPNGYGLCLWRLGRFKEADAVFTRMLWLNPADNQGVRVPLMTCAMGEPWYEQ